MAVPGPIRQRPKYHPLTRSPGIGVLVVTTVPATRSSKLTVVSAAAEPGNIKAKPATTPTTPVTFLPNRGKRSAPITSPINRSLQFVRFRARHREMLLP